jgi:hypothetical protein
MKHTDAESRLEEIMIWLRWKAPPAPLHDRTGGRRMGL